MARARTATLCTLARDPEGYPYGSLVVVAADADGRPLFLLSKLAEHTGNLLSRPEASVLFVEPAEADPEPLAAHRVTLLGPCRRIEDAAEIDAARARFLEAHPSAAAYVTFADFAFYRLEPTALRYVGGFGRMSWVDPAAYRAP